LHLLKFLFLAVVQGITEFFPISSSGHLVIFEHLFNVKGDKPLITVVLHSGTLFSIIVFYRKKLQFVLKNTFKIIYQPSSVNNQEKKYIGGIIIVTVITGVIAYFFKDFFEHLFTKPLYVSIFLFINGVILLSTLFIKKKKKTNILKSSLVIGIAQSFAIIPGISRSGSTISAALFTGWKRKKAAEFSFIAFIPAMVGAIIFEFHKINSEIDLINLFTGFLVSFLVGYFSIKYLIRIIESKRFHIFGIYCIIISIIGFFIFY